MTDRETKEPAKREIGILFEETRRQGLLIGRGGLYGNVVRLSPPLTVSAAEVCEPLRILDEAFSMIPAA